MISYRGRYHIVRDVTRYVESVKPGWSQWCSSAASSVLEFRWLRRGCQTRRHRPSCSEDLAVVFARHHSLRPAEGGEETIELLDVHSLAALATFEEFRETIEFGLGSTARRSGDEKQTQFHRPVPSTWVLLVRGLGRAQQGLVFCELYSICRKRVRTTDRGVGST